MEKKPELGYEKLADIKDRVISVFERIELLVRPPFISKSPKEYLLGKKEGGENG